MPSISWTSHLKGDDKEKFNKKIISSKSVLKRLADLAEEMNTTSLNEMRKRENFNIAAWSEKQAYELGIQKALNNIIKLTQV
jgi:hypothetical protein